MNKIDRLNQKLDQLMGQLNEAARNNDYSRLASINKQIRVVKETIKQEDYFRPQPLAEILTPQQMKENEIVKKIIEVHLVSDLLCDVAMVLQETLDKLGLATCDLYAPINDIKKASEKFASKITTEDYEGLAEFMLENDDYIDAAHKLTREYIDKHIYIM